MGEELFVSYATCYNIGVMQGRLSPPVDGNIQAFPVDWRGELIRAGKLGLSVEWIYDEVGRWRNPLDSEIGISQMRAVSGVQKVPINSLCADWFMEHRLYDDGVVLPQVRKLQYLIDRCKQVGIGRIVLPFVDSSSLGLDPLCEVLDAVPKDGVELHVETDLPPGECFLLTEKHPDIYINYDTGNSAALGYDPVTEFVLYGRRIGSVHIKDRKRYLSGSPSVPLGEGDVDFEKVFEGLKRADYRDDFILQVARGEDDDEVAHVARQKAILEEMIEKWT